MWENHALLFPAKSLIYHGVLFDLTIKAAPGFQFSLKHTGTPCGAEHRWAPEEKKDCLDFILMFWEVNR